MSILKRKMVEHVMPNFVYCNFCLSLKCIPVYVFWVTFSFLDFLMVLVGMHLFLFHCLYPFCQNDCRCLIVYIFVLCFEISTYLRQRKDLFHLPTLMHISLYINNMYVTLLSSTCFEH